MSPRRAPSRRVVFLTGWQGPGDRVATGWWAGTRWRCIRVARPGAVPWHWIEVIERRAGAYAA